MHGAKVKIKEIYRYFRSNKVSEYKGVVCALLMREIYLHTPVLLKT